MITPEYLLPTKGFVGEIFTGGEGSDTHNRNAQELSARCCPGRSRDSNHRDLANQCGYGMRGVVGVCFDNCLPDYLVVDNGQRWY